MVNPEKSITCYEAVSELDDAMREALEPGQEYYLLGGISAGAVRHNSTSFDHNTRTIDAYRASAEPNIRDNGTLRDADVLVLDVLSPEQSEVIKKAIAEAVGSRLVVSAFGVNRREEVQPKDTWFTSRRTLDSAGVHRIQMHPLEQVLSPESYEPWDLVMPGGAKVQTLNPVGIRFAYGFRSVSGVRPKDKKKVKAMHRRLQLHPEFVAEMEEGVFRPWMDMANAVTAMRWPLPGRGKKYKAALAPDTNLLDRAGFRARAIPLRQVERIPFIVKKFGQDEKMQERLQKQVGFE